MIKTFMELSNSCKRWNMNLQEELKHLALNNAFHKYFSIVKQTLEPFQHLQMNINSINEFVLALIIRNGVEINYDETKLMEFYYSIKFKKFTISFGAMLLETITDIQNKLLKKLFDNCIKNRKQEFSVIK